MSDDDDDDDVKTKTAVIRTIVQNVHKFLTTN